MLVTHSRSLRRALTTAAATLLALVTAVTAASAAPRSGNSSAAGYAHRVVAYYQTQFVTKSGGSQSFVSPLPLNGIATDVDVAAIHLNSDGSVHLNDDPPSSPKFTQMWADLAKSQRSGMRVEAMLGGAGVGSYANLHANFPKFYRLLKDTLTTYHFNGIDLDIEEPFSAISSASSTWACSAVANGFRPSQVVAGTVTNPANCGDYVDPTIQHSAHARQKVPLVRWGRGMGILQRHPGQRSRPAELVPGGGRGNAATQQLKRGVGSHHQVQPVQRLDEFSLLVVDVRGKHPGRAGPRDPARP